MNRSPSGSLCPYYYKGGELHPLKYGSFFEDKERLFAVMKAEEAFILKTPGEHNRRIWIDLYETKLDDEVMDALATHLHAIRSKIFKISLVGCSVFDRAKLRRKMIEKQMKLVRQIRFFSDPEKAKQWLVSDGNG